MDEPTTVRPAKTPGRILRIKTGYNPNSSSIGTIIFAIPAAMLVAPAIYNAIAAAFTSATLRDRPRPHGQQSEGPERPQDPQEDTRAQ